LVKPLPRRPAWRSAAAQVRVALALLVEKARAIAGDSSAAASANLQPPPAFGIMGLPLSEAEPRACHADILSTVLTLYLERRQFRLFPARRSI
jgi:hypothetical protein